MATYLKAIRPSLAIKNKNSISFHKMEFNKVVIKILKMNTLSFRFKPIKTNRLDYSSISRDYKACHKLL